MCPDTVKHDDSPSGSDGPREGHPGRPAGFGGRSILVASLLGFRCPRTQRPLVHGASGEERTVTDVPGQKCHPCSRLHKGGPVAYPGNSFSTTFHCSPEFSTHRRPRDRCATGVRDLPYLRCRDAIRRHHQKFTQTTHIGLIAEP